MGPGKQRELQLNVLLLGGPQSGKSATGNTLLGSSDFHSQLSPGAVTMECRVLRRAFPAFLRQQGEETMLLLTILDTPAYPNCLLSPEEVKRAIGEAVEQGFEGGTHILVLVVRADVPSHDGGYQLVRLAEDLFGLEWRSHALLVLTHSDRVDEAGVEKAEYLTQASGAFQALLATVEHRHHFVDNFAAWLHKEGHPLLDRLLLLSRQNKDGGLQLKST